MSPNLSHVPLVGQVVLSLSLTLHVYKVGPTTAPFTFCSGAKMVDSVVTWNLA